MATSFIMPQLGLTMTEGTVARWHKTVGAAVSAGEVLAEVSTDKIANEIESPVTGVILDILVPEGGVAPVKAVLAIIGEPDERVITEPEKQLAEGVQVAAAMDKSVFPLAAAVTAKGGWIKASPLARRLSKEKQIDLSVVTGTGPDGRVVERDILAYEAEKPVVRTTPLAAKIASEYSVDLTSIVKDTRITKDDILAVLPKLSVPETTAAGGEPLSGMRKIIAERMSLSWQTAPHVHLTVAVDMTAANDLRNKLAQVFKQKFSYTEVIVKCAAQALSEFPVVNSSIMDGGIVRHKDINIGVAVALANGLIVPVVKNANQKTVSQIQKDVSSLSGKAREGRLLPDECSEGTFTITNLGMYGVDHFTPVINPPESAILGVCRVVDKPVVIDGAVVVRPMMNLCLSFDHRLIDGALAAQFMSRIRQLLEQPLLLI